MEQLRWLFEDPFDTSHGIVVYLAIPIIVTLALATMPRRWPAAIIVIVATMLAAFLYFAIHMWLFGVSSTISIRLMFALLIYTVVNTITVTIARLAIKT